MLMYLLRRREEGVADATKKIDALEQQRLQVEALSPVERLSSSLLQPGSERASFTGFREMAGAESSVEELLDHGEGDMEARSGNADYSCCDSPGSQSGGGGVQNLTRGR